VPKIVKESAPLEAIVGLVASGEGIAIVPSISQRLRVSDVRFVELRDRYAYMEYALAWNKEKWSPVVESFVSMATKIARKNGAGHVDETFVGEIRKGRQTEVVRVTNRRPRAVPDTSRTD
jgi:hypothetical protein